MYSVGHLVIIILIIPKKFMLAFDCRLTGHGSCYLLMILSVVWSIYIHWSHKLYTATSTAKTFLSVKNLWQRWRIVSSCYVLLHISYLLLKGYITDSVVALTCYISHSAKHRKMADLYPQGAKTTEAILVKLGMVDCARDCTPCDNFDSTTWVVWANMWHVASQSFFFAFFSMYPGRISWPIRRSIHQNSCFWPRMCLLGVSTISDYA